MFGLLSTHQISSFGAKFQTSFVVCFVVFNRLSTGKTSVCKVEKLNANSIDSDETAHHEPSHLDLCCLQKPIIIAYRSERVSLVSRNGELVALPSTYLLTSARNENSNHRAHPCSPIIVFVVPIKTLHSSLSKMT